MRGLEDAGDEASPWRTVLRTRASLVDPSEAPIGSDPRSWRALAGTPRLHGLARTDLVVRSVFRLDRASLAEAARPDGAADPLDALHARAWLRAFDGDHTQAIGDARAIAERASAVRRADLRVYASALAALASLGAGAREEATESARRAVRMARAEGILFCEYLSGLVLARARRLCGLPHLSARILAALGRVVPAPIRAWIDWELSLHDPSADDPSADDPSADDPSADDPSADDPSADDPSASGPGAASVGPSRISARPMIEAAARGDLGALERAAEEALSPVRDLDFLAREHAIVRAAIDAREPTSGDATTDLWLAGETSDTPPGLSGLCCPEIGDDGSEIAGAFVIVGPGRTPRRVLRAGLGAFEGSATAPVERAQLRTLTAIAILAYAGPAGLRDEELFERVYGFALGGARHAGTLRQLVHRMRDRLGDDATVERRDGGYVLIPHRAFAVPDPRCSPALDELILQFLGRRGGHATTHDVADALGVALRTVQVTMKQLVEDGACLAIRQGRSFDYALEDTTFHQPTLTRLSPVVA